MNHYIRIVIMLYFWICSSLTAAPVVTYFFREYPLDKEQAANICDKLKRANGVSNCSINGLTQSNPVAGIFSTYFGFLGVSNSVGQTTFPRKQSAQKLFVVVTNRITPIMMFQNTISHWELETGTPAAMYSFERLTDEETKLPYWDVQEVALPENNHITSLDAIIIIAKPKNVYVPTGASLTKESANLVLPDMYIKKSIHQTNNALYMLNLTPFFRPVDLMYKKQPKSYEMMAEEY